MTIDHAQSGRTGPDEDTSRDVRQEVARQLAVTPAFVLAWALFLGAADSAFQAGHVSRFAPGGSLVALALLSAGVVSAVVLPVALARQGLVAWAGSTPARRWCLAALEGVLLALVVAYVQSYFTSTPAKRALLALAVLLARLGLVLAVRRFARLAPVLALAFLAAALALEGVLPVRQYPWLHLALDVSAALGALSLLAPYFAQAPRWLTIGATVLALSLLSAAPLAVRRSSLLRGLLYDVTTHARAHAVLLGPALHTPPREPMLGTQTCAASQDAGCAGAPLTRTTALSGAARGADVLVVSLDALRWDDVSAVPRLLSAAGPHVRFTHAVSPAPHTAFSFGALWRGRPLRQVPFATSPRHHVATRAPETLASVLRRAGYRALYAPTHRYLAEKTRVARGFEQLVEPELSALLEGGKHFPTASALGQLLTAAGSTDKPLLAWVHAMDTHAPYHWNGGQGPRSREGQRHAARDLDGKLSEFVRAFKERRGPRPLVLAVLSDHGEEFHEHGGTYHSATVFAEQVRVPWLLAAPGLPAAEISAPVSTAALPRTLLDLLGIASPCTFTLESVLPCIAGRVDCPALAVSEYRAGVGQPGVVAYTTPNHRLLYDRAHDVLRLFHSERDPYEQDDLLAASAAPPELDRALRSARAFDARYCTVEPAASKSR